MRLKPEQRLTAEVAEARALAFLCWNPAYASQVADVIWPGHSMKAQGAGAAYKVFNGTGEVMSEEKANAMAPIRMLLWCPECGDRHLDIGDFATRAHHTHACQSCGMVWRPCVFATVGVQWLPGFKNDQT